MKKRWVSPARGGGASLVAAHLGDTRGCEEWTNAAIGIAAEAGEPETLVRVARIAGDASLVLKRLHDAAIAYERALEIAQVGADEIPPPAAEVVAALVGTVKAGGSPELLRRAIPLAKEALEDPDAWWNLAALLYLPSYEGVFVLPAIVFPSAALGIWNILVAATKREPSRISLVPITTTDGFQGGVMVASCMRTAMKRERSNSAYP